MVRLIRVKYIIEFGDTSSLCDGRVTTVPEAAAAAAVRV